jgi:hypothetical protein
MEENFNAKNNGETGFTHEELVEKQQSPEEIIFTLEKAAETQEKVQITVKSMDGKFSKKLSVILWTLEGDLLWIITQDGEGMPIELSRIEKIEQKKEIESGLEKEPEPSFEKNE